MWSFSRRELGELLDVLGGRGCGIIWSVGGGMVEYVVFRSWLFGRGVAAVVFHVINWWDKGSTLCMDRAEGISGGEALGDAFSRLESRRGRVVGGA